MEIEHERNFRKVTIYLRGCHIDKAKVIAKKNGVPYAQVLRKILDDFFKRKKI